MIFHFSDIFLIKKKRLKTFRQWINEKKKEEEEITVRKQEGNDFPQNERGISQRGQRTMERKYRVVKKWRMKGIVALATRFRRKLGWTPPITRFRPGNGSPFTFVKRSLPPVARTRFWLVMFPASSSNVLRLALRANASLT